MRKVKSTSGSETVSNAVKVEVFCCTQIRFMDVRLKLVRIIFIDQKSNGKFLPVQMSLLEK